MSVYIHKEKIVFDENGDNKKELVANIVSRINKGGEPPTVSLVDHEKRMRREIANSNERRRMQSINNGFQSLRSLLPHHEGEKLSKAAILQQTAEYIYSLEQEKTRLLSQNCQLKRLVSQHEGGELPPKKRLKTEIIEAVDETAGSTETVKLITVTVNNNTTTSSKESPTELKTALDRERNLRLYYEDQVAQLEQQLFHSTSAPQTTQVQYLSEDSEDIGGLQLVTADSLPPVGHTQTIVCSPPTSRCSSPEPAVTAITVEPRLPSVLEAAIKAEPKVEVERLPSPNNAPASGEVQEEMTSGRIFNVSNTSRQNLETIVEAIRHLEGDHMFGDEPTIGASVTVTTSPSTQDIPLALTKRTNDVADTYIEYSAATVQKHQQSRPGVIVVKQVSYNLFNGNVNTLSGSNN